jgi:nicotinate-nucleotide adenylyltransferase
VNVKDAPAEHTPQRTLIFGGTFDPPHRAHVELPQLAARELGCQRILYVPAAINPLKGAADAPPPTPAIHRLAMLKLALQDVPNAEISTIELERPGPSYTIDTLKALAGQAPSTATVAATASSAPPGAGSTPLGKMFLLIGADQALDFHRWKDWTEILRLATPAVMLRPPWTRETFAAALRERYGEDGWPVWERCTLNALPTLEISATEIRRRLQRGRPLTGLVHPRVEAYVRSNRLFGVKT